MTEASPPQTLAERALARLRAVASGNGLEPASVAILEAEEKMFVLDGAMDITPLCEIETASYPGGIRGKDRKAVANAAALQSAVIKHKQDFRANPDWIVATIDEIKTHDSQGWGLENAKVTLPQKSAIYAATELCPSCQGRKMLTCEQCLGNGTVTCTQCQGQGREQCYYCGGRGEDPQQPGQRCHTCNGTRMAPCRFCQSHGYLPCPTCQGRRGTPCGTCQASGKITQEVTMTCGAETHFKMTATGLPSGLRRGLDRIGIANLGKGHADIAATPPPKDEDNAPREGAPIPVLTYRASLPYAELRVTLGAKKAVIAAVGKRCAISGVPPFLDVPLQPWRDKLHLAAAGKAPLAAALEAKAIRQILSLTIAGKGRTEEARKFYPFGISPEVLQALLNDTQLALNKTTLKTRTLMATGCGALALALFYALFVQGFEFLLVRGLNRWIEAGIDLALLGGVEIASWAALNFSTRFVLKKRFPDMKLAVKPKIGKTGWSMIAGIVAAYILCLVLAPVKPLWLALLVH